MPTQPETPCFQLLHLERCLSAIGGQVLLEVVFSWPGLGREIVQAVTRHDYPLAQGSFIIISMMMMIMNLVADVLYAALDPRISYD